MAQHFLDTGVLLSVMGRLEAFADNTGMQVKVKSGAAWIVGHYYSSDAEKVLPIASAHATLARIDRIVVRADFVANTVTTAVVQGVAAAAPTEPPVTNTLAQHEISLALVNVPAAATSLAAGAVADDRSVVASFGDRFDPGPVAALPSTYPGGVTIGLVAVADGWPVTGTLTTHKRSGVRTWQELVQADQSLPAVPRYFRQGYYGSAGPNAWGPWQRVRSGEAPAVVTVGTAETSTSVTYASLATAGPDAQVTVGPSGRARIVMTGEIENSSAGQTGYISAMVLSGPSAVSPADGRALVFTSATAGAKLQASRETEFSGLTPGTYTFRLQYRVTGGTGTFRNRQIVAEAL